MKKKIAMMLSALMIMISTISASADLNVNVFVDEVPLDTDVMAFIEDDRTLVPMRAIFEAVGASVNWDSETQTVIAAYKVDGADKFIILQIGNNHAFVGGVEQELDVPAKIVNDRTFVPLRFVMESLGYDVSWHPGTFTVDITTKK